MKKVKLVLLIIYSILFSNCSDDEYVIIIDPFFNVDNAAEVLAVSMAANTYGAVNQMNYVSDQIVNLLDCNETETDTISNTEISENGEITVTYTISRNYSLECLSGNEIISYEFNSEQSTSSNPLDTNHNIIGDWVISGSEADSEVLTYNGNYIQGGQWIYNYQINDIDNTTASFVYDNVKANKEDGVIFEGSSTFNLEGTSTVYEPYNYEGNIVFLANNICIATFATGEQYEIDLSTGDVTSL